MKTFFNPKTLFFALASCSYLMSFGQAVNRPAPVSEEIKTESSTPSEDIFVDDIVRKRIVVESKIMSLQPIREADISWEKRIQRVIDTREKMNLPFRSVELNLFSVLRQLIQDGAITAFSDESFKMVMTKDDIDKKMSKVDTLIDLNPDTYEEVIKIVRNDINWEKIEQFRVKEVWYFDKQRSVMDVRILGIAPLYASDKDKENGLTPYPLFWIYFPEAREPMSKFRVFNEENDIAPMSWADLFDARVFSSYIYKKSNVLDYRLKDFYVADPEDTQNRAGIDMLLQSEKIKNELLNFEHDLWEY
ncbi:MAG: gliding motility protein GldN [Saprospiraceae bacterium]|jgi:gliding motility associated protien GldN|nr:gliding motility protein GldN [Saprospiraceae bacterium]MBL0026387.1 gliding motility protein GldN [Saprospiraceae bacterium]